MSWSHIIGHDSLVATFSRVVQRGRLAHAYLFVGPVGVGKRLFAQELAKALLCEAPRSDEQMLAACDRCQSCLLVDSQTHPDYFTIAKPEGLDFWIDLEGKEKNVIPIDVMRAFCQDFSLKPARGHGKVAVIDGADDFSDEAANCFLKTLEEPPPGAVFFLIGTGVDRQLPTILSRCQIVRFRPLPNREMEAFLRARNIGDATQIGRLVRLSGGSPGQGLALADPGLWDFRAKLLEGLAKPRVDAFGLAKSFMEFVEDAGKELALQRRRASLVLGLVIAALTECLALCEGRPAKDDADKVIKALTGRADTDKILTLIERCLEAQRQIDRYLQLVLVLEALLDSMGQTLEEGNPALATR